MARAFTDRERSELRQAMLELASGLLREKRLKQIAVEDITRVLGIAKGSFYSFFPSKEALFWAAIKGEERALVERIAQVAEQARPLEDKLSYIFGEMFLDRGNIIFYLTEEDLAAIVAKLPDAVVEADREAGQAVIRRLLRLCGLSSQPHHVDRLMAMLHTLQYVAASPYIQLDETRESTLRILVEAFSKQLVRLAED